MKVLILSHRRSGTGLLYKTLRLNFNVGFVWGGGALPCIHGILDSTTLNVLDNSYKCIQIIRDGRDVLKSNYRYWVEGEEKNKKVDMKNISFSEFLHGKTLIDINRCPMVNLHLTDPVDFWVYHTTWYNKLFTIKYEDLVNSPENTIRSIQKKLGVALKNNTIELVDELIGRNPDKGVVGDWRNYFSKSDLNYFWDKASIRMKQLGYSYE